MPATTLTFCACWKHILEGNHVKVYSDRTETLASYQERHKWAIILKYQSSLQPFFVRKCCFGQEQLIHWWDFKSEGTLLITCSDLSTYHSDGDKQDWNLVYCIACYRLSNHGLNIKQKQVSLLGFIDKKGLLSDCKNNLFFLCSSRMNKWPAAQRHFGVNCYQQF